MGATYVPDPIRYQQLHNGDPYGGFDCTAWGAAFRCDAHTKGAIKTTGTWVRAHSSEPRPDPSSPGLNLGQVDASLIDITNGRVDLDTRAQSMSLPRPQVQFRVQDGRFCGLSVKRGVLVARGFGGGNGFTGAHDVTLFTRDDNPDRPLIFDPLVRNILPVSWDAAFDAAEALTDGLIYAQFTRDRTPDYRVRIIPSAGSTARAFKRFLLDGSGRITRAVTRTTPGLVHSCTPPSYHARVGAPKNGLYLVMITEGDHRGWWVNARFSEELNP